MRRIVLVIFVVLSIALGFPQAASAHPLGNFTINQYSRLLIGKDSIRISYIVDQAEIPTFQERQQVDTNKDGHISQQEQSAYLERLASELLDGLMLAVDGHSLPLQIEQRKLEFPAGQASLSTMRLELELEAALPNGTSSRELHYTNSNYAQRLGWREIIAQTQDGVALEQSNVAARDQSAGLTHYPENMLASPLDQREARLSFKVAPGITGSRSGAIQRSVMSQDGDLLTQIMSGRELSTSALATALLLAFMLGAGHALTPGHGKTVVAAYLVGTRGTPKHALFLGLTTTITHTAGVFILGIVTLTLSHYILPEQIFPWLELISGLLVVIIGLGLVHSRIRSALAHSKPSNAQVIHASSMGAAHQHDLDHHHSHDHAHEHDHEHDHSHDHGHEHQPHDHDHSHGHHHGTHGHSHSNDYLLADWMAGNHKGKLRWRELLALGISGGLLPCPSALVVLLSAIAIGRVGFGMLLIVAFSLGLAAVLTGIGIALVYARSLFTRVPRSGFMLRVLPVASAIIVTLAGLAISFAALRQVGVM